MKFDHKVKHNGIWYEPFEEVPILTARELTQKAKSQKCCQ